MELGIWCVGFGVWVVGFGVWGLGFGVWALGVGGWGLMFGVWGLGRHLRQLCAQEKRGRQRQHDPAESYGCVSGFWMEGSESRDERFMKKSCCTVPVRVRV